MKNYPNDGPPLDIQAIRLNPNRTQEEMKRLREWVRHYKKKGGRPETVEAYDI